MQVVHKTDKKDKVILKLQAKKETLKERDIRESNEEAAAFRKYFEEKRRRTALGLPDEDDEDDEEDKS